MHLEASFRVELGHIWELQGVHLGVSEGVIWRAYLGAVLRAKSGRM
jgi:hypothetical protein